MLNALPYILLVLFFGGLAGFRHWCKDAEKVLMTDILAVVVFVWFFGFRGFAFYDYTSYYPSFMSLPGIRQLFLIELSEWPFESGFTLLALLCKIISPDFQFFILITTCINTILLVTFLKRYHANLPLGLMIYLGTTGITLSTDLMRNSLAILIFANALVYIERKSPIPYFLLCLLCYTIHSSSLIFIPLYFLLNREYDKRFLLILFIVSNIIYVGHIPIVKTIALFVADLLMPSTKQWIEFYLSTDVSPANFLSIGYIERLISGGLLFAYMDKLRTIRKNNNIFINSMILYLCLFLCLSEFRTISVRCSTIFSYAYWILWIDYLYCFTINSNRRLFAIFLILYSVMKTYGNCNTELASYYNVCFTDHPYMERLIDFRKHVDAP